KQAELREKEAIEALQRLEEVLAVGLLRPLGHAADRKELNDFELEAMKELASLPRGRERVRLLFLEKALDQPGTRGQLGRRLEVAVHAAVGLNDELRGQVLAVLRRKAEASREDDLKDLCRRIEELLDAPGARSQGGEDDLVLEPVKDAAKEEAKAERESA